MVLVIIMVRTRKKNKSSKKDEPFWELMMRADGRVEYSCPHGVGHGWHPHGCDGCCSRKDFPLDGKKPEDVYNAKSEKGRQLIGISNYGKDIEKKKSVVAAKKSVKKQNDRFEDEMAALIYEYTIQSWHSDQTDYVYDRRYRQGLEFALATYRRLRKSGAI